MANSNKAETKAPEKVEVKAPEIVSEPKAETKAPEKVEIPKGDFIMKVSHLSWGLNNKNHFYADKKPEINAKVMGKYADTLKIWLKAGWIEKGSYK